MVWGKIKEKKNSKLTQVKLRSTKSFLGKDIQLLITSI